ncbi:uncharacterized protein B0I36DRAFT_314280, partial [Microdochium trichocladiopsis]
MSIYERRRMTSIRGARQLELAEMLGRAETSLCAAHKLRIVDGREACKCRVEARCRGRG